MHNTTGEQTLDGIALENTLEIGPQGLSAQNKQFWTLQIAGWFGYTLVVFLAIIRPQMEQTGFNLSGQLLNLGLETLAGFTLSYFQWIFIGKIVHLPLKKTLLYSFVSAATLGVIFNVFKLSTYKVLVYQQQWNEAWDMLEFGGWLLFSLSTMLIWTSIFFIMLYNTKLQKEHEMLLRAQTAAKDAQLQMLRYQLNPHFMFNTMNAISTLIFKNENDKANEMLDKLCEFFRYSLDKNDKSKSTLKQELELLDLYLSIEKVRFGERLQVEHQIDRKSLSCQVPSMLLQPLVENAIKYAVEMRKEGGTIQIKSIRKHAMEGERLIIEVVDQGHEVSEKVTDGFGIGLSNTKARLDAMFNGDFELSITESLPSGTTVRLSIPIEK